MLCRVADSLFWMSRYIERAESTSRLVDVNLQLLLEGRNLDDEGIRAHWQPILMTTGDADLFHQLYDTANSRTVTDFLTLNRDNPSSVYRCVRAARENARMIRDQISAEMWEIINRLYLFLKGLSPEQIWHDGLDSIFLQIKEFTLLFRGVTESTFLRRVGYDFIKAGCYLERADKTGRILDIKHYIELPRDSEAGGVVDVAEWIAILRACSALDAYHQVYVTDVVPTNVCEFLLFASDFPRSMRFCVSRLQEAIHNISGCPVTHYSNEAERLCGRLVMDLSFNTIAAVEKEGLHRFLIQGKEQIAQIAVELNQRYMFFPIVDPTQSQSAS